VRGIGADIVKACIDEDSSHSANSYARKSNKGQAGQVPLQF
jgi:hypothetical protein